MLLSQFRHSFTGILEFFRKVLEVWLLVLDQHDSDVVIHMDGRLEIEVLNYRDFSTSRDVTMTDRHIHIDQPDIHDAVRKRENLW